MPILLSISLEVASMGPNVVTEDNNDVYNLFCWGSSFRRNYSHIAYTIIFKSLSARGILTFKS